jgi:hypothetical protein
LPSKALKDWFEHLEDKSNVMGDVEALAEELNGCVGLKEARAHVQELMRREHATLWKASKPR